MNFFRFYNQNKITFWIIIFSIIMVLMIIRILNNIVIINNKKPKEIVINEKLYENKIDIDEHISDEKIEEDNELVIDQFIKYCNEQNILAAYNLLSNDCKNEIYMTEEVFKNNYYNIIFNQKILYGKELYIGNTYKVEFYSDMLSTGKIENNPYFDYYTIVKENNEIKLNISSYIGSENLRGFFNSKELNIQILKIYKYIDYEIYDIKVTNLLDEYIVLDTKMKTNTISIKDDNDILYYAAGHEIPDYNLKIKPKTSNTLKIKFIKKSYFNESKKINFNDIILNYKENTDMNSYERKNVEVII